MCAVGLRFKSLVSTLCVGYGLHLLHVYYSNCITYNAIRGWSVVMGHGGAFVTNFWLATWRFIKVPSLTASMCQYQVPIGRLICAY